MKTFNFAEEVLGQSELLIYNSKLKLWLDSKLTHSNVRLLNNNEMVQTWLDKSETAAHLNQLEEKRSFDIAKQNAFSQSDSMYSLLFPLDIQDIHSSLALILTFTLSSLY